jgi:formate/nitrite transporter
MAERMEDVGVKKAVMDGWRMFALAILAGSFTGLGANFFTVVITDNGLGFGVNKLLGGMAFCLGLILVVVAGAELFTGNNLIVMAWVAGKLTLGQVMRNWLIVYLGNLVGSLGTVIFTYLTQQWALSDYHVGATALNIAVSKVSLSFSAALARGILCNALVCLAVWLTLSGRSVTDKILAVMFPITAFVVAGFEHSIANMYFIPIGLLMRAGPRVVEAAGKVAADLANLNAQGFLHNLFAVTTGNMFGGGFLVAVVYWFIYLRPGVRAAEKSGRASHQAEAPSLAMDGASGCALGPPLTHLARAPRSRRWPGHGVGEAIRPLRSIRLLRGRACGGIARPAPAPPRRTWQRQAAFEPDYPAVGPTSSVPSLLMVT